MKGTVASRLRLLLRCPNGTSLVEFTLVLPFLLTLALGVAEFGRMLFQYQLIVSGVRDAGRYLARLDDPVAATAEAQNLATTGRIDGTALRVSYWGPETVNVAVSSIANPIDPGTGSPIYRAGATVEVVEVTTTVTYQDIGMLSALGLGQPSFDVRHQERRIGE